jgi:dTDP-4-amino-4,6-dideoxygalactose transaminase
MGTTMLASRHETAKAQPLFQFLDLRAQFEEIREEVMEAVTRTMQSQRFILGPEVESLESEIAEYVGCQHAIGCASGSDALLLALMAVGVSPGDEVITTPFTFVATAGAIARLGAKPVFVDIDLATYNLDASNLEKAVNSKTRAVIPVHLYGLPADMESILGFARQHQIPVIEDAAQALGAECGGVRVGNHGTMGAFSFFPSKNLGGAGDGGMITTNDPELADRLRLLRVHGSQKKYHCELIGLNSRLDALQASILRVKLRHLETWTQARCANADHYRAEFAGRNLDSRVILPTQPDGMRHVYNQFVIGLQARDEVKQHLHCSGIPTEIYYPEPLHLQPAFTALGYKRGDFPNAEAASQNVLALPIYPELTKEQQSIVVNTIAQYYQMN